MNTFFTKIRLMWEDKTLRKRVFFTLAALIVFRLLATIPIPGVDTTRLANLFSNYQFLGLLNIFSGGGLSNLSIVMLGVGPYITASIIMQLLTLMVPRLKEMYQEEGEAGRKQFALYSRWLTLPLALLQAYSFIIILQRSAVVPPLMFFELVRNVLIITAGSVLLVWVGEMISEFGIGNGASLIIFAGIVSRIPTAIGQEYARVSGDPSAIPTYLALALLAIAVIYAVVVITEAERPIPVTYAKRVRGMKVYGGVSTYLPLRLNQSGVIPIIFALSILLFPQMILGYLSKISNVTVAALSTKVAAILAPGNWVYIVAYFILIFLFTYFYTAVTFDPEQIATNLQRNGAFIPGVRPGQSTSDHIYKILTRITLFGASFLAIIAILPLLLQKFALADTSTAIGGTALLIVVSVVIDLIRKVDAQLSMREY
jgi:preprotein translocase subunit SecY